MATQVTIDELQDWLSEQPENTVETPYELEVTGLTVDNYRRINRTSLLTNKYIDLRSTVLPSGISLGNLFAENDNLVYAPVIPEGLTDASNMFTNCRNLKEAYFPKGIAHFSYTFYQCISLKKANITSSNNRYRNLAHMFEGCSSLEVVEVSELVQDYITYYVNMFSGCNNIVLFKSDRPYELKQWLNTIYNESTDNFPKDPDTCAYNLLMTPAEIPITLLSNELSALSENTVGTPYDIKITGLTNLNLNSIKTSLLNNSTKYVNLSQTVLPKSITDMGNFYSGCTSLVVAPNIPESVKNLGATFWECTNLLSSPVIPNSVTDMTGAFHNCTSLSVSPNIPNSVVSLESTFWGCTGLVAVLNIPNSVTNMLCAFYECLNLTSVPFISESVENMEASFYRCSSLVTIPNIPNSVVNLEDAFYNCTSLTTINEFNVAQEILTTKASGCFYNCTSLTTIGVKDEISESSNWNIFSLKVGSNNISGKVYDKEGNSSSITQTNITKTSVKMPIYTDELWFPASNLTDSKVESIIQDMIAYKYGVFNRQVIPPNERSFVLWANDTDNLITNLTALSPVDRVESGNMSPVTSNAVAQALAGVSVDSVDIITGQTNANLCFKDYKAAFYLLDSTASNIPSNVLTVILSIFSGTYTEYSVTYAYYKQIAYSAGNVYIRTGTRRFTTATTTPTWGTWFESSYGIAHCHTTGGTAAKVADMRDYILQAGATFPITFTQDNSSASALTLSINGTTAKPIYINNSVSSASNYTLPAGTYLCRYNGTNYYIDRSYAVPNARSASSATTATRLSTKIDNIRIGSSQAKITLNQLMTWLITTKAYIPSDTWCFRSLSVAWDYSGNDILQLSVDGINYELQLAGVMIEFMGKATDYQTGIFRLRIHSSPTTNFTATSGYTKFPVDHIAEYTCNGSSYSPVWKMILEQGDSARAISGAITCSTAAGTAAKTVELAGFKLAKGARLSVTLSNANTVASALTLNVNGTGAKTIRWNGTVTSSSTYAMTATTYNCYYDGTYWNMDSSYEAYNARNANYASSAGSATTANKIRTSAPSSPVNGDIWLE